MFDFLKKLYEPIRKGNEYRESVYGKPKSIEEEYTDMSERLAKEKLSKIKKNKEMKKLSVDPFYYQFHKTWTGARFVVVDNPILNYSDKVFFSRNGLQKKTFVENMMKVGETCTYDPVSMMYFHGNLEV